MSEPSIYSLLTRIWKHLSSRRRMQLALLLALMMICALSEVVSLGAVLPFIGIMTAPEKVFHQPTIRAIADLIGLTTPQQLIIPLAAAFATVALIAGLLRLLLVWTTTKLSYALGADLSVEVYRRTLYQPYRVHVARNSSEIISAITSKTWTVVVGVQSLLSACSSCFQLIFILSALLIVDASVTLVAILVFVGSYGAIILRLRKKISANSATISREINRVVKALQEGSGGIRDILLTGTQSVYCNEFRKAEFQYRKAHGSNAFMSASPRLALEPIAMILMAVLAVFMSYGANGIASGLPVLGALALGAQRLIPAIQTIYSGYVNITGGKASFADILSLLDQPIPVDAEAPLPPPLKFNNKIELQDVRFRYLADGPWVIDGVNLVIPAGRRVGFVGATGGGKSTLVDLLMGLLEPTEGQILVDGAPVNDNSRRSWQRCVAHVPQSIFLADTTLAENIALGIPKGQINMDKVREAAKQAQIDKFIESRPKEYESLVGERGIRLSGGQRQRIGIARALYRDAAVLIFDEATSSLDNATERAVMESINSLGRDLTIILIAHRLTTVQSCDQIIELEKGRVVAVGTYQQLLDKSSSFRKMARAVA